MNMFLLSSLPDMIIDSVTHWAGSRWVAGLVVGVRLVGGSVVRRFNETQEVTRKKVTSNEQKVTSKK